MAQLRNDACGVTERRSDRVAGDERKLRPERHRRSRVEENGEEKRPSGRGLPAAAEAPAPVRLEIGCDRRSFAFVPFEQALCRSALLDEPIRAPEAPLEQRLDGAGGEIRHSPLD
jgi:hypothetical protein